MKGWAKFTPTLRVALTVCDFRAKRFGMRHALGSFFIKLLAQPVVHKSLDFHAALVRLSFDLFEQFRFDRNRAYFKIGVRCVGVEFREVGVVPETANLFLGRSLGHAARFLVFHKP